MTSICVYIANDVITAGFEFGMYGHNASFIERTEGDVMKVKNNIFLLNNASSERVGCSQGLYYTNNAEDYDFITTSMFSH